MREKKIYIYFKDKERVTVSQKAWDDYEVNYGLFVVKKKGAWIFFAQISEIKYVWVEGRE